MLGEPASGLLTNLTGTLTSPTFVTPALGTPASGVATNITALDTTELTAGVLPTDITGGEGLTALGTVASGTLGAAVDLNHDSQSNGWHLFAGASTNVSSAAILDFNLNNFIGSNVSESGGTITVTDAGMYFVSYCVSCHDVNNTNLDWNLRVNGTQLNGTRVYIDTTSGQAAYVGETWSGVVRVAGSQTLQVYGTGYYFGASADSMTSFKGCRIGAYS